MGGGSNVVIGYQYYLGLQFCLCQDSLTEIKGVFTNNKTKYMLDVGTYLDGADPYIDKPDLYGGRKKGGGVQGQSRFRFGGPLQTSIPYLDQKINNVDLAVNIALGLPEGTGTIPLRGLSTVTMEQSYVCSMNPTMRPWEFLVYRKPNMRHVSSPDTEIYMETDGINAALEGYDVNPAAILEECFFNDRWGLGLKADDIDLVSLESVMSELAASGVGVSFRLAEQTKMKDFIREVLSHVNGVLFIDPSSGKIGIRLLLATDTPQLTVDTTNLVSFDTFERTSWSSTINELVVEYTNQDNYDKASLSLHSSSNLDIQGDLVTRTVVYKGFRSEALVARAGARDLGLLSYPIMRINITVNKEGWDLKVGDQIQVTYPDYDLLNSKFRVLNVDYGDIFDSKIKLTAIEDVLQDYSTATEVFGVDTGALPTVWEPILSTTATPPNYVGMFPLPYYALYNSMSAANFNTYDLTWDTFCILADKPTSDTLSIQLDDNAGTVSSTLDVTHYLQLTVDQSIGDGRTGDTIDITANYVGVYALSATDLSAIIASNDAVLVIGDELFLVTNITGSQPYTITVRRGAFDTVPQYHVAPNGGALNAWIFSSVVSASRHFGGINNVAITDGITDNYHVKAQSFSFLSDYASSPALGLVGKSRANRPHPPRNVTVSYSSTQMTINWQHDSKLVSLGTPPSEFSNSNSAESADIRTQVYVRAADGTVLYNAAELSTTTQVTLTKASEQGLTADGRVSPGVFIELYTFYSSNSVQSLQRVSIQSFRPSTYGEAFADYMTQGAQSAPYTNTENTLAKQYRYVCEDSTVVLITGSTTNATIYVCDEDGAVQSTISGGNCNGMLAGGTFDYVDVWGATAASAMMIYSTDGVTFKVCEVAYANDHIHHSFTIDDVDFSSASQVLGDTSYWYVTDHSQAYPAATATGAINAVENVGFTSLLLHNDATGLPSAVGPTFTLNGTMDFSVAQARFGGASALFDGTDDSMTATPNDETVDFGTDDFTIEFWVFDTGSAATAYVLAADGANGGIYFEINATNQVGFNVTATDTTNYNHGIDSTITASTWHHFALVREGNNLSGYFDGNRVWTQDVTGKRFGGSDYTIAFGSNTSNTANRFTGHIDEVRIQKGIAEYSGLTYTVPTAALTSSTPSQVTVQADLANDFALVASGSHIWADVVKKASTAGTLYVKSNDIYKSAQHNTYDWIQRVVVSATPTITDLDYSAILDTRHVEDFSVGPNGVTFYVELTSTTGGALIYFDDASTAYDWLYDHAGNGNVFRPYAATGGLDNQTSRFLTGGTNVYFVDNSVFSTYILNQNHRPYYIVSGLYTPADPAIVEGLQYASYSNNDGNHYKGALGKVLISSGALVSSGWCHNNPWFVVGANDQQVVNGGYAGDVMERIIGLNSLETEVLLDTKYTNRLYWVTIQ